MRYICPYLLITHFIRWESDLSHISYMVIMPLYGHNYLISICKLDVICINSESRHVTVTHKTFPATNIWSVMTRK